MSTVTRRLAHDHVTGVRAVPAAWFHAAIVTGAVGPYRACVDVKSRAEYRTMRCFLTADDSAGFAITASGDIVSVFSAPGTGRADLLITSAIALGGRTLDCFDTILPALYAAFGFVETDRMAWDDAFAPTGWDAKFYARFNGGRPDVVSMALAA